MFKSRDRSNGNALFMQLVLSSFLVDLGMILHDVILKGRFRASIYDLSAVAISDPFIWLAIK